MMNWTELLSKNRLGVSNGPENHSQMQGRSEFQKDFDRVVFSSAFRRLQDKTQVFPMPESDFVHTRLTHSLEVSCIGRSLGNLSGERILMKYPALSKEFTAFHFGEIVSAACLAHDIGNPPFGHSGEDSIAEYFRAGNGRVFESRLERNQWNDFIKFEGNAQGFRILTRLQNPYVSGGLQLTYATLGAFVKYPKESYVEDLFNQPGQYAKQHRKFGFFQSEKELFKAAANHLKLGTNSSDPKTCFYCRHPLSFLVEAADDICYRIMDLEDGFRLGLISFEQAEELLSGIAQNGDLNGYAKRERNDKIGYLRAKAMNSLVEQISEAFAEKEEDILNGRFLDNLIYHIHSSAVLKQIKDISRDRIYSYRSVIERELAGYEVLGGLLDTFIEAVNESAMGAPSHKHSKILQLLPRQFMGADGNAEADLYTRLLKITDFVSGMTDSYAISLFRKIKGISLPNT